MEMRLKIGHTILLVNIEFSEPNIEPPILENDRKFILEGEGREKAASK